MSQIFFKSFLDTLWMSPVLYTIRLKPSNFDREKMLLLRQFLNQIYSEISIGSSLRLATLSSIKNMMFEELPGLIDFERNLMKGMGDLEAWQLFACQIENDSITQFVIILEHAQHSGNYQTVLKKTTMHMNDRLDMAIDISVAIAAKKFEFYAMMITPIVLLMFLEMSNKAYMQILFESSFGRVTMSVTFLAFLLAFAVGRKIIRIEV